ncbi:Hypothetical protein CINCED_3A017599 [Cinara cedri]|uniref:Uncharacterized protein n=1 Tax=Cinara cedri TaxID=506608 RepID=A0A5E4N747_9HEMI|nr:Hypothetical protein CINCED_3A017599 [Cinara cedri]
MFTEFAVLDISKTKIYDYYYNVMRKHFKKLINLIIVGVLNQDTILLCDLLSNPEPLECTNTAHLPRNNPCYVVEKKKIAGLSSEETDGKIITEFCAL